MNLINNFDVSWERRHLYGPGCIRLNGVSHLAYVLQHARATALCYHRSKPTAPPTTDWCPPGSSLHVFSSSDINTDNTGLRPSVCTNNPLIPVVHTQHYPQTSHIAPSVDVNNLVPISKHLQPASAINKSPVTINMALLNVCSILNKASVNNDSILDSNLDYLLWTETWLGTDAPVLHTEACPPDFNFLFSTTGGKRGGGTASVFKNTLSSREVS